MKKVLSLVLSLCLIVSLGAGISFDTADAAFSIGNYDLYWNFMKTNIGTTGDAYLQSTTNISYNTTGAGNAGEVNKNVASEPYAFFGYSETAAGNYAQYASSGYGILMFTPARAQTTALAMKLWSNRAGKYVPMLNVHGFADYVNATTYDFYIIPVKGTETTIADINLADAIAHKTINFGAYGTYDEFVPLSDTPIDVQSAKEYFVVAKSNQGGTGSFCFDGVLFKEANAANLTAIQMNMGQGERYYEVKVGEKIEIPFDMDNAAGGKIDLTKTAGWSEADDTAAVHLRANLANSTIDITGLAVNDKPETMWVRYGTCAVYFNVKVNAADYEPADRDLTYDWYKPFTEGTTFGGVSDYPTTVTMGMTTVGSHSEINKWTGSNNHNPATASGRAVSIYSDPIGFYQKDGSAGIAMTYHNYGGYFTGTGNLDFIIKVPFDGYFTPSIITTNAAGSANKFKVMSLDGATTYATVDIAKGAQGTFTSTTSARLPAGYYILRHENTASGTNFFNTAVFKYDGGFDYSVTLNANGGTLESELTSYAHKTGATLPAATKEGYNFDGWYTTADFSGAAVTAIPANSRGAKTFYAKYTYVPKNFDVTLNTNGGTVASDLTSYTEGQGATLPTATKAGYTFGGWYDNAECLGTAVTAIAADDTGAKEFWAKWTLDASASDFTITSDSGYYAYYVSNPYREGVIAVSAYFAKYATAPISKAGIMIYVAGNENNEAKIARVETSDVAQLTEGKANALFTGIAKANFGKEVIAKAYVVIDGQYVYSDAVLANVEYAKWLGVKPE